MEEDQEVVETTTPIDDAPPVEPKVAKRKPIIRDPDDAILELRKENESLRKRLDSVSEEKAKALAEERIALAKTEAREEAQRLLDARIVELEGKSQQRIVRAELKAYATKAGAIDFDDLYLVMSRDMKVEFDTDGNVTNAAELIANIKDKKPHLFSQVSTSSTAPAPVARREEAIEKTALNMSKEEYAKARRQLAAGLLNI